MFDQMLQRINDSLNDFSASDGIHGILGIFVFILGIYALANLPRAIRSHKTFWFLEIVFFPLFLIAVAGILELAFEYFGFLQGVSERNYISAVVFVLASAYIINRVIDVFVWKIVMRTSTNAVPDILKSVITTVIYIFAGYIIIAVLYDRPLTGLVISSSVLLAVVGLALQPVLQDFIGGISLSVDRPFKVGDWIEIDNGTKGQVINIDWRATRILTYDETVYIVPNNRLANANINNFDLPTKMYRHTFYVPVARSIPPKLVIQLLIEAALKSPNVLEDPGPIVRLCDVNEMPMKYAVSIHCAEFVLYFKALSETLENAWLLFDKAGFSFAAKSIEAEVWRGALPEGHEPSVEEVLSGIPILSALTGEERKHLVDGGVVRNFRSENEIVRQDEEGESAFIILAGLVVVHRTLEDGRDLILARLGKFDFFGEMSLLTGATRSANVTAHTDCQLLEIPKPSMSHIMQKRPEIADELAQLMAERKLKQELLAANASPKSVSELLNDYKRDFARTIRAFLKGKTRGSRNQDDAEPAA